MSRTPAYYHDVSMKLASVLEDVGVNEHIVHWRRRSILLCETLSNNTNRVNGHPKTEHFFGSQSEGTTTRGLNSDYDFFSSLCDSIVILDKQEVKPGLNNFLMVQDMHTAPGYCMLQVLNTNCYNISPESTESHDGKTVLKNTHLDRYKLPNQSKHGPAAVVNVYTDKVYGYPLTLPNFLKTWLYQQLQKRRITEDMKQEIESKPCFVVPVGSSKSSPIEHLEWRISTSHAERCVMFSLNITQIQCYVMFKLMLQTYLKHPNEEGLSSFMCKNIVLLCIENSEPKDWCPQNLISLFKLCLLRLKHCVSEEYCPHFIMHESNLMAGKFTTDVKYWLLDKIQNLYKDTVSHFTRLPTDNIGIRLKIKLEISNPCTVHLEKPETISCFVSGYKLYDLAQQVIGEHKTLLQSMQLNPKIIKAIQPYYQEDNLPQETISEIKKIIGINTLESIITKIIQLYNQECNLVQAAALLVTPLIYSSLGSEIASRDIQKGHPVSAEAMVWLSLGLDSDVASGRLKLASVFYCTGSYHRAEAILRIVEDKYDKNMVEAVCNCIDHDSNDFSKGFQNYTYGKHEHAIKQAVAYGIKFLRSEIKCAPKELQYEMFRSTKEDLAEHRHKLGWDDWMDWAVVDSLPYLYFLQYKTYGYLQRPAEQQQAFDNLKCCIHTTKNLEHKETAMNLLGQCMEQEKLYGEAIACYIQSLKTHINTNTSPKTRLRNNAASLHICRLLNSLVSTRCHLT